MSKSNTWMPLYIGDYLADTSRLTTEGHGAYILLIMDYWRNGAPPDDDEVLASIARLPLPRWRKLRPSIECLFKPEGGIWHHKRADTERAKAGLITKERSAAGKAGAEARWGKRDSKRMANAMANATPELKQNDGPSQPQPQYSVANATGAAAPSMKDMVWKAGLDWLLARTSQSERQVRTLVGKWMADHGDAKVYEAFQQAFRNTPVEPIAYIEKVLAGTPKNSRGNELLAALDAATHSEALNG